MCILLLHSTYHWVHLSGPLMVHLSPFYTYHWVFPNFSHKFVVFVIASNLYWSIVDPMEFFQVKKVEFHVHLYYTEPTQFLPSQKASLIK